MSDVEFETWYRAQHPKLVSALTAIAGDVAVAAESVDEACARAYERWGPVSAMASPAGWTFRTALNVLRRRHRRSDLSTREIAEVMGIATGTVGSTLHAARRNLARALALSTMAADATPAEEETSHA